MSALGLIHLFRSHPCGSIRRGELDTALGRRAIIRFAQHLQRAVENLPVHRQIISPRRTERIENAGRRKRLDAVRNITRQIEGISG